MCSLGLVVWKLSVWVSGRTIGNTGDRYKARLLGYTQYSSPVLLFILSVFCTECMEVSGVEGMWKLHDRICSTWSTLYDYVHLIFFVRLCPLYFSEKLPSVCETNEGQWRPAVVKIDHSEFMSKILKTFYTNIFRVKGTGRLSSKWHKWEKIIGRIFDAKAFCSFF